MQFSSPTFPIKEFVKIFSSRKNLLKKRSTTPERLWLENKKNITFVSCIDHVTDVPKTCLCPLKKFSKAVCLETLEHWTWEKDMFFWNTRFIVYIFFTALQDLAIHTARYLQDSIAPNNLYTVRFLRNRWSIIAWMCIIIYSYLTWKVRLLSQLIIHWRSVLTHPSLVFTNTLNEWW